MVVVVVVLVVVVIVEIGGGDGGDGSSISYHCTSSQSVQCDLCLMHSKNVLNKYKYFIQIYSPYFLFTYFSWYADQYKDCVWENQHEIKVEFQAMFCFSAIYTCM